MSGGRGQVGCVQRMEVIVKRKKKLGGRAKKCSFCENSKKKIFFFFWGGGGWGVGLGGGVRVDVNGEVKLL